MTRILKTALTLLFALTFMACSPEESKYLDDEKGLNEKLTPVVKKETCSNYANVNSVKGAWVSRQVSKSFNVNLIFDILDNELHLTNRCEYDQVTISANVWSPITHSGSTFKIWEKKSANTNYDKDGVKANCDVELQAETVRYEFYRGCLVLKDTERGVNIYLVKYN